MVFNPDRMNRTELLNFMDGYMRRLDDISPTDENERIWIALQMRLYEEIKLDKPIFKVSNMELVQNSYGGAVEYNTKYFVSLRAAKRELRSRLKELSRSSDTAFIARPEEIMDANLSEGVAPSLIQSIITNQDLLMRAPGRFKFYEVRICEEKGIVPIQLVLTQINVVPKISSETRENNRIGITFPFPNRREESRLF